MMKYHVLLISILLFASKTLFAQSPFEGGIGSGGVAVNLGGVDTCVYVYAGEIGSGSTDGLYSTPFNCDMFFGDTLSGYYLAAEPSTQDCFSFLGETGSGYHEDIFINSASCPAFYASVSGGDGYHARSYSDDNGVCYIVSLPIESSPLFAKIQDKKGYLYWTTYTELNNMGFEIQKSFDGISWQKVGWIDGAGTYLGELKYEFWDNNLQYGDQYYRFVQIDYDNTLSISNMVNLSLQEQATSTVEDLNHLAVYPNPVQLGRTLSVRSWISYELKAQLLLYNTLGQLLHQYEYTFDEYNSLLEISTQDIPSGHYFLVIMNKNDRSIMSTQKIIIVP